MALKAKDFEKKEVKEEVKVEKKDYIFVKDEYGRLALKKVR